VAGAGARVGHGGNGRRGDIVGRHWYVLVIGNAQLPRFSKDKGSGRG
jgi:hypothetical protein